MRIVRLGDVATIDRTSVQPEEIESGTLYVGLENIESGGQFLNVKPVEKGELASSKFRFTANHLLYGKLRPYLAKIALPSFDGICSTDILPIFPSEHLDVRYLKHYLSQPRMVDIANSLATGANLPRISPKALADLRIPLPALQDQKHIAAVLDKADEIRRKREVAIAKLDQLSQSVFVEMLSSQHDAPLVRLGDVVELRRGASPRPISKWITNEPDGVNWVKIGDATASTKYIVSCKEKIKPEGVRYSLPVREGDFLLSNSMSFGRPYIMRTSGCIHDGWLLIRDAKGVFNQDYLFAALTSEFVHEQFKRAASGAVVKNLNIDAVSNVVVHLPPMQCQLEMSAKIAAVEAIRDGMTTELCRLRTLFRSLQSSTFGTGIEA